MGQGATSFESIRLTPALGAEIRGLDLSVELDEVITDSLYDALLEHHVLVFGDPFGHRHIGGNESLVYGRSLVGIARPEIGVKVHVSTWRPVHVPVVDNCLGVGFESCEQMLSQQLVRHLVDALNR